MLKEVYIALVLIKGIWYYALQLGMCSVIFSNEKPIEPEDAPKVNYL